MKLRFEFLQFQQQKNSVWGAHQTVKNTGIQKIIVCACLCICDIRNAGRTMIESIQKLEFEFSSISSNKM